MLMLINQVDYVHYKRVFTPSKQKEKQRKNFWKLLKILEGSTQPLQFLSTKIISQK